MDKKQLNAKKLILIIVGIVLIVGLCVSVGFNIYQAFYGWDSYLQSTEEIYIMEAGILKNNFEFQVGEDIKFVYDFDNAEYANLKNIYELEKTAKDGTEFSKALNLMNEYSSRLKHKSDYDNHIEQNASALLSYALDNKKHGINCRAKAQILNEMCLSLGIYSRKVWIMPNSGYDGDCHVVNEVWDSELNKWIMLDITNNEYWVDENGMPLSILEIRDRAAKMEFCTPVMPNDKLKSLQKLKEKRIGDFLYIVKNLTYMEYCAEYGIGESDTIHLLFPQNLPTNYELIISRAAVESSPLQN